jgi:hypothetical protein
MYITKLIETPHEIQWEDFFKFFILLPVALFLLSLSYPSVIPSFSVETVNKITFFGCLKCKTTKA